MKETQNLKGRLRLLLKNREGIAVREVRASNRIVHTGRMIVARLFSDLAVAPISHFGVGTGTNDTVEGDVTLNSEIIPVAPNFRKPINAIQTTDIEPFIEYDQSGNEIQRAKLTIKGVLDYSEGNGNMLTEAGLFNADIINTGDMYNRVKFDPIEKTFDFQLHLFWEIIF